MKILNLLSILTIFAFFVSCSESGTDEEPTGPQKITLELDKTSIIADGSDVTTIVVRDENQNLCTSKCDLFVNGEALNSDQFKTDTPGDYNIKATYDNLTSNSIKVTAIDQPITSIEIKADKTEVLADGIDGVTLTVFDNLGNEITSQSKLFADGNSIDKNMYSTTSEGKITFKAAYESFESTVEVTFTSTATMPKRVLIEDYTGTWCGYCPRVAYAIEDAIAADNRVIAMAIHNGDPMQYVYEASMRNRYKVDGLPTAKLDRHANWSYPENYDGLKNYIGTDAKLGIAISTSLNDRNAEINIQTKFVESISEEIKLVVCLTENKLIESQANYYDDGKGNPIINFEHNHVLRQAFTDIFGDDIPSSSTTKDNIYEKVFSANINTKFNLENCYIVAFIVKTDGNSDEVLNVQQTKLGSSSGY